MTTTDLLVAIDESVNLARLVRDGVVKSCASLYPVQLWFTGADGSGAGLVAGSLRFVLAAEPGEGDKIAGWVALGWRTSGTGGDPVLVYANRVAAFSQINSAAIIYTSVQGDQFRVKRDAGCSCGSRMRSWQPFSEFGGALAAVPKPAITA